jgi:hypothetical protein
MTPCGCVAAVEQQLKLVEIGRGFTHPHSKAPRPAAVSCRRFVILGAWRTLIW